MYYASAGCDTRTPSTSTLQGTRGAVHLKEAIHKQPSSTFWCFLRSRDIKLILRLRRRWSRWSLGSCALSCRVASRIIEPSAEGTGQQLVYITQYMALRKCATLFTTTRCRWRCSAALVLCRPSEVVVEDVAGVDAVVSLRYSLWLHGCRRRSSRIEKTRRARRPVCFCVCGHTLAAAS